MAAVEITTGIVSTAGTSTLTYTPDLPGDSEASIYAVITDATGTTQTVPGGVTADGIVGKLSAVAARYHGTQSTAIRTTMGLEILGTNNYDGGVLAPNGKIYSCPRTASQIVVVDSNNDTADIIDLGIDLTVSNGGTEKWGYSGVLGIDGRIYFCPRDAPDVLIIDPATDTATRTNFGVDMSLTSKWRGGVAAPNGKIYFIPRDAPDVLIIDVKTQTATRSNFGISLAGSNKWMGGTLAPNGKIYCTPIEATDCLVIDTADDTAVRTDFGINMGVGSDGYERKWTGSCLGPDGKIYGVPNLATDILIIDPVTDTATRSNMGAEISTTVNKWSGSAIGPDGKIYCIPFNVNETEILVIDAFAGTAQTTTLGWGPFLGDGWVGGTQGLNGKIYCFPRSAADLLVITPQAPPLPPHLVLGSYLNKF